MTAYSAKIRHIPGLSEPDEFDFSSGQHPAPDFVVSRDISGKKRSCYGDLLWDRSAYSPVGRTFNLNFQYWDDRNPMTRQRQCLVEEMHWLMLILIYLKPGSALSNQTLAAYVQVTRFLARYCEINSLQIKQVLSVSELSFAFIESGCDQRKFVALQVQLRDLGAKVVGFDVARKDAIEKLRSIANRYRDSIKQYPPIPTRIFSIILRALNEIIQEVSQIIESLLSLASECYSDPLAGMGITRQKNVRSELSLNFDGFRPGFDDLLKKYGLTEFWAEKGYEPNRPGLSAALMDIQHVSALQILAYSGMRGSEALSLPYHCLRMVERDGCVHYILKGSVTKLTKGKIKQVQWVTSSSGHDAIRLAQRIAFLIYSAKGDQPIDSSRSVNKFYLFVSPNYVKRSNRGKNMPAHLISNRFEKIRSQLLPAITKDDLDELRRIDPHRDWDAEEKFKCGQRWPLTAHQLRRSLALYAQRSGLVSLPSLKRQLQHITLEMAMYYARGSSFAVEFIGDGQDRHFGEEWQATQPVSQYLSYAADVLFADEVDLYGGHAHWINMRLRNSDGLVMEDRTVTLKRFHKGELAYKPTPVGGCVNPGPCDKNPIDILHVECIAENCKYFVGNLKKTERVVMIKSKEVEMLRACSPGLPELIHEEAELKKLVAGYELAKARDAGKKEAS